METPRIGETVRTGRTQWGTEGKIDEETTLRGRKFLPSNATIAHLHLISTANNCNNLKSENTED